MVVMPQRIQRKRRDSGSMVHVWYFLMVGKLVLVFVFYCLFLFVSVLDLFYYLWIIWYDYCCFRCWLLWWTCRFDIKYQNNHLIGSRTSSFQDGLWSIMFFHCFMVNDRCNRLYGYSQTSVVTWWFRHIMFSAIGTWSETSRLKQNGRLLSASPTDWTGC